MQRRSRGEGEKPTGSRAREGQCSPFLRDVSLYLLKDREEEEREAADRCAGWETTPLYMSLLKVVSPGGVFKRQDESGTRFNLFILNQTRTSA